MSEPKRPVSGLLKQDGTFAKGVSGNPAGRPRGARNKATMMIEAMFDGEAAEIGRKAIELAKEGHATAIKLILERTCPPRRGRPMNAVALPPINSAADVLAAAHAVAGAVSEGALTPDEARTLTGLIDAFRKTYELADIERRLAAVEQRIAHG